MTLTSIRPKRCVKKPFQKNSNACFSPYEYGMQKMYKRAVKEDPFPLLFFPNTLKLWK